MSGRLCCCPTQPQITNKDVQNLLEHPENHLRNLPSTYRYEIEGATSYQIRNFFADSQIAFKGRRCLKGLLLCCGSCSFDCKGRCPQDVINRAYLLCGNIIWASDEFKEERYKEASFPVQMLYQELVSEHPRYFAVYAMVREFINESAKLDYAPQIEYEEYFDPKKGEWTYRKAVDSKSGEVYVLQWPSSGMCPFCLPIGLSDRRRLPKKF